MNVRASELDALNKQGMTPIQAWHTAVEQIGNFSSLFSLPGTHLVLWEVKQMPFMLHPGCPVCVHDARKS